ncbi:unnamed protein product [Brassicogethes aeneus]|uniref:Cyclic nucleotide-binding domain-containing protein n=1 Tax=Brassicogethes aeneus TaxID=1431903 RepID=A0A9P0BEI8_BRAAE|nr:unnamed protein product [Brassicogethes aeneus]
MIPDHNCQLHMEDEDLVNEYIVSGVFISLRRKLKRYCLCDERHPEAKLMFKSKASIEREQSLHLYYFYNTVHPYSLVSLWMETFLVIAYGFMFFTIPIFGIIDVQIITDNVLIAYSTAFEIIVLLMMIWKFKVGCIKKSHIELDMKQIAVNYLKTTFILEISVLLLLPLVALQRHYINIANIEDYEIIPLLIIYMRVFTISTYMNRFQRFVNISSRLIDLLKLTFVMVVIGNNMTCIYDNQFNIALWKKKEGENASNDFFRLVDSFYTTYLIIMGANSHPLGPDTTKFRLFSIVLLLIGVVMNFLFFLFFFRLIKSFMEVKSQKLTFMRVMMEYMQYNEFTPALKKKILTYYDFKYGRNFYVEADINSVLPENVIRNINAVAFNHFLKKISFYHALTSNIVYQLSNSLVMKIFLAGDTIVHHGVIETSMYFIYVGTVAIYTKDGVEICHLTEGDYFGEFSLLLDIPKTASVVAIENCKVFKLSRDVLYDNLKNDPRALKLIKKMCLARAGRHDHNIK